MSTRGWTERVKDILDAIAEIDTFIAGMVSPRLFGGLSAM
jgi:hypothetical protein